MKIAPLLLVLAALSVPTLNSCITTCEGDPDICPSGPVAVTPIEGLADYSDYCFAGRLTGVDNSTQHVINSGAEYEALFPCAPRPVIDFSRYTLLAGKTRTATGSSIAEQQVTTTCDGYRFTVRLRPGITQATAEVAYFAVIPKLPAGAQVVFDVQQLP